MIFIVKELQSQTAINFAPDLNEFIDEDSDLVRLSNVRIQGVAKRFDQTVTFELRVFADVTQKSARSLKEVDYPLDFEANIVFSDNLEIYDYMLTDTIDLSPIIYAYIENEKPLRVFHESDDPDAFSPQEDNESPFASLKDYFKT